MSNETYIHPQDALQRIAEYQTINGMTLFNVQSTVEQRVKHVGDIIVHPVCVDIDNLVLLNVICPNFVIDVIQQEITYDVPKVRTNID